MVARRSGAAHMAHYYGFVDIVESKKMYALTPTTIERKYVPYHKPIFFMRNTNGAISIRLSSAKHACRGILGVQLLYADRGLNSLVRFAGNPLD